jgi:hypothetical protein
MQKLEASSVADLVRMAEKAGISLPPISSFFRKREAGNSQSGCRP